jgi:SAM-dependent methyltransferase
LQSACVYGNFSAQLAQRVGPEGSLDVVDIVPIQVRNCRRKLTGHPHGRVRLADAADPGGGPYDAVCCFFLLHELPDYHKQVVIDALLDSVVPGGKVVFVDYHRPNLGHPLKGIMNFVFRTLEPYAPGLLEHEIADSVRARLRAPGRARSSSLSRLTSRDWPAGPGALIKINESLADLLFIHAVNS